MPTTEPVLPKEAIKEYQAIYLKKFQVNLNFEEAQQRANNFIRLMALITNTAKGTNG